MRRALFILCVLIAAGCCVYVGLWLLGGQRQKNADRALAEQFRPANRQPAPEGAPALPEGEAAAQIASPLDGLLAINPDALGWIKIDGTVIDYPVVQGSDNEHYLSHDFYGEQNKHGAIFLDYRCTWGGSKIIYGHRMKDGAMFRDLERFKDEAFQIAHNSILLYDLQGAMEDYRISGVLDWKEPAVKGGPSLYEHLVQLEDETPQSKVLFLVTCESNDDDARLVIIARLESSVE